MDLFLPNCSLRLIRQARNRGQYKLLCHPEPRARDLFYTNFNFALSKYFTFNFSNSY